MIRVAILSYNGASFFELGCAIELFSLPRQDIDQWYNADVVTFDEGDLQLTGGVTLAAKQITDLSNYDLLIVPSWSPVEKSLNKLLEQSVKTFHASHKRIYSFCSGAFLLAELGLLDKKQATTHWKYAAQFKVTFPSIEYVEDVLYVIEPLIGTSAGSAAALDLGIEIIRQDFGYDVANNVARQLVLSAHRSGGQSQFVQTPVLKNPGVFAQTIEWALVNLSSPIDVDLLASKANMSRRSFDRKFRSSFNIAPQHWLTKQRLELAKSILETQAISIDEVALRAGFSNAFSMRHHFRKIIGISPKQYKQQFQAVDPCKANNP